MRTNTLFVFGAILFLGLLSSCGQDPSFMDKQSRAGSSDAVPVIEGEGDSLEDNDANTNKPDGGNGDNGYGDYSGNDQANEDSLLPSENGNDWMPDWVDGGSVGGGGGGNNPNDPVNPEDIDIPGADDDDLGALHKCLAKWNNNPFGQTVTNYRKIHASVTVGGYGNAVNDTEDTTTPQLVLITAGVNVGGAPQYNLLNKNGFYCMKVNVNVNTQFTINLHCNARLADSKVNVNVGSTQNDTTSDIGVHVNSVVNVNSVRPSGDTCIR